ncbi:MAG TPA: FtsX-like permease family protein [Bryobacteraceae bacterium]|jgi:putative ABC transport system permease protein
MINKLVFENLKHRWVRTVLSAIVIGVQVTTILTLVGLSRGMLQNSAERARGVGADIWLKPEGASAFTLSSAQVNEKFTALVSKQPHVKMALGVIIVPVFGFTTMAGVDLNKFVQMSGGFRYLDGGPIERPDDIIVDNYYQEQNHVRAGQEIKILNHQWRVAGVVEAGKLSHLIASKDRLQELTGNTGRVTQIVVKVDDPKFTNVVIDHLNNLLKGNLKAISIDELTSIYNINNLPQLKTFINVVIGLSVIVGFLVVFLSMYTAVIERTREIGVLKALGAKPLTIVNILLREALVLAILGSIIGIGLAYGAKALIMTLIPFSLQVVDVPDWWPIAALIAIVGAFLGALYPGVKAAKQDAIEALAYD